MKLYSWNTNGIRAAVRHGMLDWLEKASPDILCVQETKVSDPEHTLSQEILAPLGYKTYWNWPKEKKGYSGVAVFSKTEPLAVEKGLGRPEFDNEGRTIVAQYPSFTLLNIYFPNGKQGPERLDHKMKFYDAFLEICLNLIKKKKKLIMCGDYNTAHKEIDLAHPKNNSGVSGFLPEERAWLDSYVSHGFHDTLRMFHEEPQLYTWWDLKTAARERNVGWRIDYIFVSDDLKPFVKDAFIAPEVGGSDHCPIGVEIDIS
jgi:exodeoxyribonuclease III